MTRRLYVGFRFNREEDRYEAWCQWCGEVVRSFSLEGMIKAKAWLPEGIPHDCPVEP